jgi:hypothetical protein
VTVTVFKTRPVSRTVTFTVFKFIRVRSSTILAGRHSLSISPVGRGFAAGPRAESSEPDSAFIFQPKGVTRAFPSNVIAWRESCDRAQLSRSREEQGELFIFCSLCSLLFWTPTVPGWEGQSSRCSFLNHGSTQQWPLLHRKDFLQGFLRAGSCRLGPPPARGPEQP